jgi:hypothetical protein
MVVQELERRIERMTAKERSDFWRAIGAPESWGADRVLEMFIKEPAWEKNICHQLGQPTESDKLGQASIRSAFHARWQSILTLVNSVVAIAALAVAVIALCR